MRVIAKQEAAKNRLYELNSELEAYVSKQKEIDVADAEAIKNKESLNKTYNLIHYI